MVFTLDITRDVITRSTRGGIDSCAIVTAVTDQIPFKEEFKYFAVCGIKAPYQMRTVMPVLFYGSEPLNRHQSYLNKWIKLSEELNDFAYNFDNGSLEEGKFEIDIPDEYLDLSRVETRELVLA